MSPQPRGTCPRAAVGPGAAPVHPPLAGPEANRLPCNAALPGLFTQHTRPLPVLLGVSLRPWSLRPRPLRLVPLRLGTLLVATLLLGSLLAAQARADSASSGIDPDTEATLAYSRASEALSRGQWALAEQWLERVLMYQPHNAAAQLELAELLAQRGAAELAQALVAALLADPRTPAERVTGLRSLLQRYQHMQTETIAMTQAQASPGPAIATRQPPAWQAGWQTGWSHNPTQRTRDDSIELTTGQGPFILPLANPARPGVHHAGWLQWQPDPGRRLQLQWHTIPVSSSPPLVQLQWTQPLATAWRLELGTRQAGSASRYSFAGVQASLHRAGLQHSATLGAFEDDERARAGSYLRLQLGLLQQAGAQTSAHWLYENNNRTGGVGGSSHTLHLHHDHRLAERWTLQALLRHHHESEGYSPLLKNNSKRHINTGRITLLWHFRPTQPDWTLQLHAEKRGSNLPLFRHTDAGLTVFITHKW